MSDVELKPGWLARDMERAALRLKEWQRDLPVNHEEAYQLAQMKQGESNLARCYLAVREALDFANSEGFQWPADPLALRTKAPTEETR